MNANTLNVGSESGNTMDMSVGRLPKKGRERKKRNCFQNPCLGRKKYWLRIPMVRAE